MNELGAAKLLASSISHWKNGEIDICRRKLEMIDYGSHCSESILLLARVLIYNRNAEAAIHWLDENMLRHSDEDALAVHWMLLGHAYAFSGNFTDADRALKKSQTVDAPAAVLAEVAYVSALSFFQRADYSTARKGLANVDVADDLLAARTAALSGAIDQAEGKFANSYVTFSQALRRLKTCSSKDFQLYASIVNALAVVVAETGVGDPSEVDAELSRSVWNASTTGILVDTLRHLGLAYQRRGNVARAVDRFIASADAAAGTAWSVSGYAEYANAALAHGETLGASAFAEHACSIVERIERVTGWSTVRGEQRLGLLTLALTLARLRRGMLAAKYRDLYYQDLGRSAAASLDIRTSIFEQHVAGAVAYALGEDDGAAAALHEVARRWASIGCDVRAADAAADAYRGRSGHLLRASYSKEPASRSNMLSARDERILEQILAGKSYIQIADDCGLAIKSVRAITSELFSKFKVESRAELLIKFRNLET